MINFINRYSKVQAYADDIHCIFVSNINFIINQSFALILNRKHTSWSNIRSDRRNCIDVFEKTRTCMMESDVSIYS